MARFAVSLLALLLVASYSSATTIEDLCKDTYESGYCVKLLRPTVSRSTNFKSEAWHKKVLNRALVRAMIAQNFMIDHGYDVPDSDVTAAKSCVHKLHNSVKLIKQGNLDAASANQESCYDSLEDAAGIMKEVRAQANEALMASRIASDIIAKV